VKIGIKQKDRMKTYHKIQSVFKRDMENNAQFTEEYAMPEIEYLKDNQWIFTEKIDGTNIRIMFDGGKITYGGKTDNAQLPCDLVEKLHQMFDGKLDLFRECFKNTTDNPTEVCLYGEGYGSGIQKGGCYQETKEFVLFDIKIGGSWLLRENIEEIAEKFEIKVVPIIGSGTIDEAIEMTKKGFNSQWGNFVAEGIVARPKVELRTRKGDRVITKIKHKDFK
jgi:ATP-dependent RNA circularization protein (DNA/RNA ligase family)